MCCTFGGKSGYGNHCANGGALSSIGVSWNILDTVLSYNTAVGHGANSGQGGNGGAIYNDGNTFSLSICGTEIAHNTANEGGGAIFFVSNDRTGTLIIEDSLLEDNPSAGFETQGYPGIFVLADGEPQVRNSIIQ